MALTSSVYMITFSHSGLMTTALLKTFAMRPVGITGALLFSVPTIMSPLVTHVWHLVIISFMRGIGLGLMSNICNANFNAYWVKNRTRVMSAAHAVIGLGGIVYPIIIEKCMRLYGFRGTSALMSGLSLNCIAGMMLMHPVEWHTRDPGKVRMERARLVEESRILSSALSDLFELSLFKDRVFMTTCLGMSFVFVSDFTFSSLLPLMIIDFGYDTREAALAITVAAAAELISRILLALFTLFVNARPKMLFFLAMTCMVFAITGFFYCDRTLPGTVVSVAAIGMVRSCLLVTHLLVVVENFPAEKYVATCGIFSLVSGTIMMSFGPIIGFIKDSTNSFTICQLVLIGLTSVSIVPWSLDFLAERKRTRQKTELLKSDLDEKENSESQPVN